MQLISRRDAFLKDWLVIIFSFLVRAPWREMGEVVHLFWGKDLFRDEDIGSLFKGKSSNNFINKSQRLGVVVEGIQDFKKNCSHSGGNI